MMPRTFPLYCDVEKVDVEKIEDEEHKVDSTNMADVIRDKLSKCSGWWRRLKSRKQPGKASSCSSNEPLMITAILRIGLREQGGVEISFDQIDLKLSCLVSR
jgi:hypothetical protein